MSLHIGTLQQAHSWANSRSSSLGWNRLELATAMVDSLQVTVGATTHLQYSSKLDRSSDSLKCQNRGQISKKYQRARTPWKVSTSTIVVTRSALTYFRSSARSALTYFRSSARSAPYPRSASNGPGRQLSPWPWGHYGAWPR